MLAGAAVPQPHSAQGTHWHTVQQQPTAAAVRTDNVLLFTLEQAETLC
jgi:hypothetical protein